MFWKFNLLTSHIDTLLDKEDVTLHEILDEDDVLQECKAQNTKLLDFIVKSENIEELVNLITTEPSEESEERVRYKFPNTACELLTSDVTQINDKLASEETLLGKIYGFLESEAPLNPLLASFFSKVMGLLITRKSEMMLEFLKGKDDFMGQLLRHLGTSAIMDLLLRLITCIEATDTRAACITWLCEQNLVQKLIAMIDPSEPEEKHCNAAQSLCDIVRLSREQMSQLQEKAEPDPLLQTLESEETVTSLLTHMFNGEKVESVIVNGLCVIQTLLEFRKLGPEGAESMTSLDAERLAHGVTNTIAALTPRLNDIHQILVDPPKQYFSPMPTTLGQLDPPLGNSRLQVAKLLATLLHTNTHSLNVVLENLGTMNVLLELFFKYSWSNFLHTQVEVCIATVLSSAPAEVDGNQETPLLNQLLGDTKLVQNILERWEENDQEQSRPKGQRKGYMGHLTHVANQLTEQMEKGTNVDRIKEAFQELPAETREKWETFVSGTLADVNKQNTVELVGRMPLHSSSEDDDPDFNNIQFPQDTAMQQMLRRQAFSDYQLQQMTSNFIDQFGFNEDEFAEPDERVDAPFTDRISSINFDINSTEDNQNAATLFEQACNERIQQLDDQDSDEDLWEEKEITFSSTVNTRPSDVAVKNRLSGEADDSDGSSDSSEEDLDSPRVIRSAPASSSAEPVVTGSGGLATSEKMDIDSDWQANFDDVPMEPSASSAVAMDTTTNPWENSNATSSPTPPTENPGGESWANFESATTNENVKPATNSKDNNEDWADFTAFSSIDSQSLSTTAPESQQRSTSPVAMDTADSTSNRTQSYLVSSAPADLASETSSAVAADSSPSSTSPSSYSEQQASGQPQGDDVPSSTSNSTQSGSTLTPESDTGDVSSTTTFSSDVNASPVIDNVSDLNSNNAQLSSVEEISSVDEPPPLPTRPPPNDLEVAPDSTHTVASVANDKYNASELSGDDDEDLSANFNFLASSGLMKNVDREDSELSSRPDSSPSGDGAVTTNSGNLKSAEQDKLEQVRAQAKEALEEYTAAANTKRQNGPV